jgi:hypothetical protein
VKVHAVLGPAERLALVQAIESGMTQKAPRLPGGGILLRSTSSRRRAFIEGNARDAVGSDGSGELGLGAINRRVHSGGRAIDQALRGLP